MYHRFEENKYPSTNIKIEDFKSQIDLVKSSGIKFISHKEFEEFVNVNNSDKKIYSQIHKHTERKNFKITKTTVEIHGRCEDCMDS